MYEGVGLRTTVFTDQFSVLTTFLFLLFVFLVASITALWMQLVKAIRHRSMTIAAFFSLKRTGSAEFLSIEELHPFTTPVAANCKSNMKQALTLIRSLKLRSAYRWFAVSVMQDPTLYFHHLEVVWSWTGWFSKVALPLQQTLYSRVLLK